MHYLVGALQKNLFEKTSIKVAKPGILFQLLVGL